MLCSCYNTQKVTKQCVKKICEKGFKKKKKLWERSSDAACFLSPQKHPANHHAESEMWMSVCWFWKILMLRCVCVFSGLNAVQPSDRYLSWNYRLVKRENLSTWNDLNWLFNFISSSSYKLFFPRRTTKKVLYLKPVTIISRSQVSSFVISR